jgi:hypothetical protein
MSAILCLDTEPETIAALQGKGHHVSSGELGYRNGIFRQPFPPHEFEVIICDLKKPACFDALHWGPGRNNNQTCQIVDKINDDRIIQSGTSVPRFKLIQGQQIKESGRSNFDGHAVLNAAVRAGTHVFLMYNPEWAKHVNWSFPNFVGLSWTPAKTIANKVTIRPPLEFLLSGTSESRLRLPLQFSVPSLTSRQEAFKGLIETRPIVTNLVDEKFGQLVVTPKGTLWILPAFEDNAKALLSALDNIEMIRTIVEGGSVRQLAPSTSKTEMRDVFISHAWEDKAFARPLAEHLRANGITVWFDEYELKLGDSLRRRIDDGLKHSRHGLVILSPDFFKKDWPQKELDALFSLESTERRILPLLHGLTHDELKQHAPLLADKFSLLTSRGLEVIADEIQRVLV